MTLGIVFNSRVIEEIFRWTLIVRRREAQKPAHAHTDVSHSVSRVDCTDATEFLFYQDWENRQVVMCCYKFLLMFLLCAKFASRNVCVHVCTYTCEVHIKWITYVWLCLRHAWRNCIKSILATLLGLKAYSDIVSPAFSGLAKNFRNLIPEWLI